jgi:hypothetical protein
MIANPILANKSRLSGARPGSLVLLVRDRKVGVPSHKKNSRLLAKSQLRPEILHLPRKIELD